MAAKHIALAFCALSLLQTSFAGYERFWIFSKDSNNQVNDAWDALSEDEQRALIKRYQNLKEIPEEQSTVLQQRMDWFTQLPEQEKLQMREAWQQMSTTERNEMRQKMLKATSAEQRTEIREKYLKKYVSEATTNH
ncbi:DUF3106 domain-containing protein [Acinetobacter sp. 194]|uniref:DUF3106 domain-containing protein n=1 Tax=Acinetobacter shaoyimingii TaxID=2715164 RepID=UPI00140D584C|nr:DUF3106 domain-containing protein [Acinetobacter shaoyimingii]NHB57783.1 DUF3106 domain-containing protein [Acinetobacter shaoyimingii]